MYFHSSASASAPRSVREPQTTVPDKRERAQATLIAERVELAVLGVGERQLSAAGAVDRRLRARPAPSRRRASASVRANTPATAPHGANSSTRLPCSGFGGVQPREEQRGVLVLQRQRRLEALRAGGVDDGGRRVDDQHRPPLRLAAGSPRRRRKVAGLTSVVAVSGGRHSRLKMSTASRARTPLRPDAGITSSSRMSPPSAPPVTLVAAAAGPASCDGTVGRPRRAPAASAGSASRR